MGRRAKSELTVEQARKLLSPVGDIEIANITVAATTNDVFLGRIVLGRRQSGGLTVAGQDYSLAFTVLATLKCRAQADVSSAGS